jgi:hypothetical protein
LDANDLVSGEKTVLQRLVVMIAACLEIAVGVIILTAPDLLSRLLFGTTPDGVGMPLARFAGIALVALGIACMPSGLTRHDRRVVLGLLIFNVGATILLAWVAVATSFRGFLLWPTVMLHAVIAAALLSQLLTTDLLVS